MERKQGVIRGIQAGRKRSCQCLEGKTEPLHVLLGEVCLPLRSDVLTGLFHDAAQGTLYFGQQRRTHLLKLTSGDTHSHRPLID